MQINRDTPLNEHAYFRTNGRTPNLHFCFGFIIFMAFSGERRLTVLIGVSPLRGSHRVAPIAWSRRRAGLWLDESIIIPPYVSPP